MFYLLKSIIFYSSASPIKNQYIRSNSLSGKHKKLPPLSNSLGGSKTNESDSIQFNNLGSLINVRSSQPSPLPTTDIFLDTENKKRPPQRIQAIEYRPKTSSFNNNNIIHNKNLYDTVTIDILSESGRYSRQSLEPLVHTESSRSKYSSVSLLIYLNIKHIKKTNYFLLKETYKC